MARLLPVPFPLRKTIPVRLFGAQITSQEPYMIWLMTELSGNLLRQMQTRAVLPARAKPFHSGSSNSPSKGDFAVAGMLFQIPLTI
jgi:hypothetical protein